MTARKNTYPMGHHIITEVGVVFHIGEVESDGYPQQLHQH